MHDDDKSTCILIAPSTKHGRRRNKEKEGKE